jgi:hypothetical protein
MNISFKRNFFKIIIALLIIRSIFHFNFNIPFKTLGLIFVLFVIIKPQNLIPYFKNIKDRCLLSVLENTNEYKRIWAFNPEEYLTVYLNYVIEGRKRAIYLFESDKVLGYNIKLNLNQTMYNNLISELHTRPIAEIVKNYNAKVFFDGKPIENYSQEFNQINHS